MRVAVVLTGAMLLAGCLTFESRFESGFSDAHLQLSPSWQDAGLYDTLPENGTLEGFEVRTVFIPPSPPANAVPDYPMRLPIDDPGLAEDYGTSLLALVCWTTGGPSPTERMEFCLQPGLVVQAMVGWDVPEEEKRAPFRTFVTTLVNASEHRVGAAAAQFAHYDGGTSGGGSYPFISTLSEVDAGYHEAGLGTWPVRVSEAFRDMGGIDAFTAVRPEPVTWAPGAFGGPTVPVAFLCEPCGPHGGSVHGRVDLVQGNWTFKFLTPMRVATQGPFADGDAVIVTPDDRVTYVHLGAADLSDRRAARALEQAMGQLDRVGPDAAGWTFLHARVSTTEDDTAWDWDVPDDGA